MDVETRRRLGPAVLATTARLALAGVWVYAAASKATDPDAAVRAVRAYEALPESVVRPVAWGLPFVEIALAVLLILGIAPRVCAWVSVGILVVFITGIASVWARGLQIDCGCFGGGGAADVGTIDYVLDLVRDLGFVALALIVALGPRGLYERDLPPQTRTEADGARRVRLAELGLVAGVVIAVGIAGYFVQRGRSALENAMVVRPSQAARSVQAGDAVAVAGDADAPVRIELYEDYRCADCRAFHDNVEPALAAPVLAGRIQVAYHTMPFEGDSSLRAAAAVACAADASSFLAYRDQLYDAQGRSLTTDALVDAGRAVGITGPRFERCVRDARYEGWARAQLDAGSRRGVVLTPSIYINDRLLDRPITVQSLRSAIARAR
jgi:protein-disulfide isomerase/uncharacterized membrane protein YphA (DoxX/SURF4 family)